MRWLRIEAVWNLSGKKARTESMESKSPKFASVALWNHTKSALGGIRGGSMGYCTIVLTGISPVWIRKCGTGNRPNWLLRTLVLVSSMDPVRGEIEKETEEFFANAVTDMSRSFSLALPLHFLLANDKHQQREKGEGRGGRKCNDECNFPQKNGWQFRLSKGFLCAPRLCVHNI